jgi:hypothetical protein
MCAHLCHMCSLLLLRCVSHEAVVAKRSSPNRQSINTKKWLVLIGCHKLSISTLARDSSSARTFSKQDLTSPGIMPDCPPPPFLDCSVETNNNLLFHPSKTSLGVLASTRSWHCNACLLEGATAGNSAKAPYCDAVGSKWCGRGSGVPFGASKGMLSRHKNDLLCIAVAYN